jgi:hypothetical protein
VRTSEPSGSRELWWSWILRNFNSNGVASNPLARVLLTIVLGDSDWFELLRIGFVDDVGGEGREAVPVVIVMAPAGTVPSPCFNNRPRVAAFIDLLPEVDRGSVVKAGLVWILALMACTTLVVSGLLYFLFIVAARVWVALIALAVVVPPAPGASSDGATDRCGFTIALRPRGWIPIEDTGCCPSSCTSARWVRYCSLCI